MTNPTKGLLAPEISFVKKRLQFNNTLISIILRFLSLVVSAMESCVAYALAWLVSHRLMFNDTIKDKIIIRSKHQLVSTGWVKVGDSQVKPSEAVLNISSWVYSHMNMNVQVGKICSKAFYGSFIQYQANSLFMLW